MDTSYFNLQRSSTRSLQERSLDIGRALKSVTLIQSSVDCRANVEPGADGGGGAHPKMFAPPSAMGQNMIFWRKIVIFHTNPPKNFVKCAPPPLNLKSWIRPCELFNHQCFERSAKICEPLDIEVKKPRICGRQIMRDNVEAETGRLL